MNRKKKEPLAFFEGAPIYSQGLVDLLPRLHHWETDKSGTRIFYIGCATEGCDGSLRVGDYRNRKVDKCTPCREKARSFRGHVLINEEAVAKWEAIGDRVTVVGRYGGKKNKILRFRVQCKTPGCKQERILTHIGQDVPCAYCWAVERLRGRKWGAHYVVAKRGAAQRGHAFGLSYEEYLSILTCETCFYCEQKVERFAWRERGAAKHNLSSCMDRLVNSRGYFIDNITVSCLRCNKQKGAKKTAREWAVISALFRGKNELAITYIRMSDVEVNAFAVAFVRNWQSLACQNLPPKMP